MEKNEIITSKKEQAENTKQRLLDSARLLFAENGYSGTSVRSINRRIGLADGLLYHYFPGGKKEIFQAIVTQNFQKIKEEILKENYNNPKNLSLEEVMITAFHNFTKTVKDNIDIIRIVIKENDAAQFLPKENIVEIINFMRRKIVAFLTLKSKEGELKSFDFESAANSVLCGLVNYILISAMNLNEDDNTEKEKAINIIKYNVSLWKKNVK